MSSAAALSADFKAPAISLIVYCAYSEGGGDTVGREVVHITDRAGDLVDEEAGSPEDGGRAAGQLTVKLLQGFADLTYQVAGPLEDEGRALGRSPYTSLRTLATSVAA